MTTSHLSSAAIQALLRAQVSEQTELDRPGGKTEPPGFVITFTREAGALGSTIAAETGRRLGWPVYDKLLLEKIAEQAKATAFDLELLDERTMTWLEEVTTSLVSATHVSPYGYLKHLIGAVRGLAAQGRCVIVGRGASFLAPPAQTLRVRLVADLATRARNLAQQRQLSEPDAKAWVIKTDEERMRFMRTNFGVDPADPHHYDLVLNTARLPVADCAEVIIDALHRMERVAATRPTDKATMAPA